GDDFRERAGGLMCVGLPLSKIDDGTRALIDAGVCGVLLRKQAFSDAHSVAALTYRLKEYAGRPLFVAVDHEATQRLTPQAGFSRIPTPRSLGEQGEVELARHVGQIIGRELRAVGVDVTLGPTMDVASSVSWDRERTLGADPRLVAALSAAL